MKRQDPWSQLYRKILFRLFVAAAICYFLFGIIACAPGGFHVKEYPVIDKEFIEHVQKFSGIYNVEVAIDIVFNELNGSSVGICYISSGRRWIEIDNSFWQHLSSVAKEQLIFHELGHCILDRGHMQSQIDLPSGQRGPASIMYSYFFGNDDVYPRNLQYYYEQLPYAPSIWGSSLALGKITNTESNNDCIQFIEEEL